MPTCQATYWPTDHASRPSNEPVPAGLDRFTFQASTHNFVASGLEHWSDSISMLVLCSLVILVMATNMQLGLV